MGRIKVGTSLEESLLQQAKEAAAREGRSLNDVVEEALTLYLARTDRVCDVGWTGRTAGTYRLSPDLMETVLHDDPYGTE